MTSATKCSPRDSARYIDPPALTTMSQNPDPDATGPHPPPFLSSYRQKAVQDTFNTEKLHHIHREASIELARRLSAPDIPANPDFASATGIQLRWLLEAVFNQMLTIMSISRNALQEQRCSRQDLGRGPEANYNPPVPSTTTWPKSCNQTRISEGIYTTTTRMKPGMRGKTRHMRMRCSSVLTCQLLMNMMNRMLPTEI